jgi:uncharacterized protein YgiM (DUF1202 family)
MTAPETVGAIVDARTAASRTLQAGGAAIAVPAADDPRWAPGVKPGSQKMLTAAEASATLQAFAAEREDIVSGPEDKAGKDLTKTASLPPQDDLVEAARKSAPREAPPAAGLGDAPKRNAVTSSAVTMRARPAKRGGVITTIPAGATVALVDCDGWCEIVYGGKRGYIYKSFIRGGGAGAPTGARVANRVTRTAAPEVVAPKTVDLNRVGR